MNKKILTLCIIHQRNRVLLGMKKRGFGEGKWNGFGGKMNEGETIEAATRRELLEESGLTANNLKNLGVLDFSWQSKPETILQVHIFKTAEFSGEATEGEEMKPQWFEISEIPYDTMWSSDKYWFPLFLENKNFTGKVMFDENNNVLEHTIHATAKI